MTKFCININLVSTLIVIQYVFDGERTAARSLLYVSENKGEYGWLLVWRIARGVYNRKMTTRRHTYSFNSVDCYYYFFKQT